MKHIPLFILLFSLLASAEAGEFLCEAKGPGEPVRLLRWGDLVLEQAYYAGYCHLRVVHSHDNTPQQFRNFSFSEAGEIYIYAEFDNPYNPLSTFATSGAREYFLFPKVTHLKAVFDEEKDEFYVRMPSGEKIFFLHSPLRIDEQKTRDLRIAQQPLAHNNHAGITISQPRGVLLNMGYMQGGAEKMGGKLRLEDAQGNHCAMPHHELFEYYRKSYQVQPGPCAPTAPPGCRCADPNSPKERTICDLEYSLSLGEGRLRGVDGYRAKADAEAIIERQCPQLHALQLARADTSYLLDDLMPRSGEIAPPLPNASPLPNAPAETEARWSFNLVDGIRALFN